MPEMTQEQLDRLLQIIGDPPEEQRPGSTTIIDNEGDPASGETAPDLSSTFLNPDGTLKDEYLQGVADQIQGLESFAGGDIDAAIAAAMQDFNIDDQVGDAMKLWGDDFKEQFGGDYMKNVDMGQYVTDEMLQQMIANAQLQGMDEAAIRDMIKNVMGDSMSDEDITKAIETAVAAAQAETQEGILTPEQIQAMIDEGLANGLTPEEILALIKENSPGGVDEAAIAQMIADAQASLGELGGLTAEEIQAMIEQGIADGLTPEQIQEMIAAATNGALDAATIQQMIADAIAASQTGQTGIEGMSMEDIQALLDSGYMTADQINSLLGESGGRVDQLTGELGGRIDALTSQLGESGFLGQEGVDSSVAAALQAALGEGGSINSAIAAAMQGVGGGGETTPGGGGGDNSSPFTPVPVDTSFNFGEYNPGSFPTNPYGDVNPYDLMNHPYSSATTGGIGGIAGLDLGNPGAYNFDMPTSTEAMPTGIPSYQDYMQYLAAQQPPAPQAPQTNFNDPFYNNYGPNGELL